MVSTMRWLALDSMPNTLSSAKSVQSSSISFIAQGESSANHFTLSSHSDQDFCMAL
jgi:hypothetical protein